MPKPTWRILVDWDNDNILGEVNEDVTPNIVVASWNWGRDILNERAAAAQLELTLRNDSEIYTPTNATGSLFGSLLPGRRLDAFMGYPTDDFGSGGAGAGTAMQDSLALSNDAEFSWATPATWNVFRRNSGTASGVAFANAGSAAPFNGISGAHVNLGESDLTVRVSIRHGTDNNKAGLILRSTGGASTGTYIAVYNDGVNIKVDNIIAGTAANIASTALGWGSGTTAELAVEMHGTLLRIFKDFAEAMEAVSTINTTLTTHGLYAVSTVATNSLVGTNMAWFDNFGGWRQFFSGKIDQIRPQQRRPGELKTALLRAYDDFEEIGRRTLFFHNVWASLDNTFPSMNGERSNKSVGRILVQSGFGTVKAQLDNGRYIIGDIVTGSGFDTQNNDGAVYWRENALEALYGLQEEEDGFFFMGGEGYAHFEAGTHRDTGPHTAPVATLDDESASPPYVNLVDWDDGIRNVENEINVIYQPFELNPSDHIRGTSVIWQLGDQAVVPATGTRFFLAEAPTYDLVRAFINPVATTDYIGNLSRDGTGADVTGSLTVTLTGNKTGRGNEIKVVNGTAAAVYLVNASGAPKLQLRAQTGLNLQPAVTVVASDGTSQTLYGTRSYTIEAANINNYDAASTLAQDRLARKKNPKTILTVDIPPGTKQNVMQIVHRQLSDRIHADFGTMGVNDDFYIEEMDMQVDKGGYPTMRWIMRAV